MNISAALSRALLGGAAVIAFSFAAHSTMAAEPESGTCHVTLQSSRTEFPTASQHSGEFGTVRIRADVMASGQVRDVALMNSSGYPALDAAALHSVKTYWRFDTTHCSAQDVERDQIVDVNFERAKSATVSGTVDARSVAKTKALRANGNCSAAEDGNSTIFACISKPESSEVASVASNAK